MKLLELWPLQTFHKTVNLLWRIWIRWVAKLVGTSVPCHTEPEARSRKTTGGWLTQHRAQKQRVGWGRNQPAWTWKRRWILEPELKCRLNMRDSAKGTAVVCCMQKLEIRNRSEVKIRQDFVIRACTINQKHLTC